MVEGLTRVGIDENAGSKPELISWDEQTRTKIEELLKQRTSDEARNGRLAWGSRKDGVDEHGPSLIQLKAEGKTKKYFGELRVNENGLIFKPVKEVRIPLDELYNLDHESSFHKLPPINKYCNWLIENDPTCIRGEFWKLLKLCQRCLSWFVANHHSRKFCLECAYPHQLERQSNWQNVPKNKEAILGANRQKYWKERGGNVRNYTRRTRTKGQGAAR